MPEQGDLDRRLRAVERTLTDGDHDVAALQDAAAFADRLDDVEERLDTLEERADELDAATQAVRGYVGNVRSVNSAVEDRADAALAVVDRLESRLDERDGRHDRSATAGSHASPDGSRVPSADGDHSASRPMDPSRSRRSRDPNGSPRTNAGNNHSAVADDVGGIEMQSPAGSGADAGVAGDASATGNGDARNGDRRNGDRRNGDRPNDDRRNGDRRNGEDDKTVIERVREAL